MAKVTFTPKELSIIADGLTTYKDEVKKLMVKAEKLGLEEAKTLKETFLEVEALRGKIASE